MKTKKITLRKLRESLGLSQTEVAQGADMYPTQIGYIEQNVNHRWITLQRLIKGMGGKMRVIVSVGKKTYEIDLKKR